MSGETTTTDIVAEETASSVAPGSVEEPEPDERLSERIERLEHRVEEMFNMHSPEAPPHPPLTEIGETVEPDGTVEEVEETRDHSPSGVPWTHRRFGHGES